MSRADGLPLLHAAFEAQADSRPGAVAIEYRGTAVTYEQVERRSNRLSHLLRSRGVCRGSVVAILLPRTVDAFVSILGVLKAGAAYLPLDIEHPRERLEYILGDAKVQCLITTTNFASRCPRFEGVVVRMDADADQIDSQPAERLGADSSAALPDDLCYVIYTSGSTGLPKGVQVEHRSAAQLVAAERELFDVLPEDRVCQAASLSFDLSVEEVWLAFCAGATLVPAPPEASHGGPDFSRFLSESRVTVLSTVPTLLSTLDDDAPGIRLLILGGETCPDWLAGVWERPGRRVVNTYGPTETTVIATYANLAPGSRVNIGVPVPGYQVYILDDTLTPVRRGLVGEICVGGAGVARGYVGRPAETAARFVRDPFQVDPAARMYRTGDLGRYNEDGTIEFLGRSDTQVKLRGFRIELSEVESAITRLDGVQAAACAVWEGVPGVQELVGYVVARPGRDLRVSEIRSRLRESLPAFMVPSLVEVVDHLPILPNGKLDRRSLPTLAEGEARSEAALPKTETERRLYGVWAGLFAPTPVSVDDDFFLDLGGHSLLAARMVSQLRSDPKFSGISIADVYEYPTVRSLAVRIDERPPLASAPPQGPSQANGRGGPERRRAAAFLQGIGLYFSFGLRAAVWITPYLVFFMLLLSGYPVLLAAAWAILSAVLVLPAVLLVALAAKWILLGRIRPGRHPLWGGFYLRWWLVRSLISAVPLDYLAGTPLLPAVYRLFGAKMGKDVHLDTDRLMAFDLVSIGDGSSVDEDASIQGYAVEQGELVLDRIRIGRGCFVGTRSVVKEGSTIEDGGRLEDLALLPSGASIPSGETWIGSPARPSNGPMNDPLPPLHRGRFGGPAGTVLYGLLAMSLPVLIFIATLPGVLVLFSINVAAQPLLYVLAVPLVGASFVVLLMLEFVILKWSLIGRFKPGVYQVHSGFYVRAWVVGRLDSLTLDFTGSLRATLYLGAWFRALGARVGRSVELSTASVSSPDLIELDDESTVADDVSLGSAHIEGAWMTLGQTRVGRRSFVGNGAVVPAGTTLGEGTLCGLLSLPPADRAQQTKPGASWFGSPPVELPRRQPSASFPEERTFSPTRRLRVGRAAFETLRVTLPPAGFIVVATAVLDGTVALWRAVGLWPALLILPATYAAACGAVALAVAASKWAVMGRYRPFEKPLWSSYVWRLELVNSLYEFMAGPLTLEALQGTPFLPFYHRLMGTKLGDGVYLDTTGFLEWDLVEIGDGACLDVDCIIQTHLFEDRVLKASYVRVGDRCDIGADAVVLYDSEMESGSKLDALSLLMKGERLPGGTSWDGIPARRVGDELRVVQTQA